MTFSFDFNRFQERIAAFTTTSIENVVFHPIIDSTSSDLKRRLYNGASPGTIVAANRQTAGRGRSGREWHSEDEGNLYLSIALAFRKEIIDKVPLVPLAAGIAACDAIVEVCGVSPKLKWPNDVLVDGRKLGGILTELVSQKTEQAVLIVGIGVNTGTSSFPSSLRDVAVSIPLLKGKAADPSDVAARFVSTLCVWKDRIEIGETAALVAAWRARAEPFGRRVRVGALEGMTRDLTPEGRLQIVQDNGDITEVVGGIVESIA